MGEWQPIETAPKEEPVIVWSTQYQVMIEIQFNRGSWWIADFDIPLLEPVTHWMPLPEPPGAIPWPPA
jgi:hypothetical protein